MIRASRRSGAYATGCSPEASQYAHAHGMALMCLNPIATDFEAAKRPLLRPLTPWQERLQTAVIAAAMRGVFGGMDRKWDEIHVSGVPPLSRLFPLKESHMKVAQSLAALIVAGAFAAPVFAAGTASAPAAAPASAPAATAPAADTASAPKAEAKHAKKKHHAHKKAKAAAKSEAKTDAASAPKAAEPAKQ